MCLTHTSAVVSLIMLVWDRYLDGGDIKRNQCTYYGWFAFKLSSLPRTSNTELQVQNNGRKLAICVTYWFLEVKIALSHNFRKLIIGARLLINMKHYSIFSLVSDIWEICNILYIQYILPNLRHPSKSRHKVSNNSN